MHQDIIETMRILSLLSDGKGHANWEIAEYLNKEKGNTNKKLNKMKSDGLIEIRDSRPTTKPGSSRPNQREFPYYISKGLRTFDNIIDLAIESDSTDLRDLILDSEYMNTSINGNTFVVIYNAIEKYLGIGDFKRSAANGILTKLATVEEYQKVADLIYDYLSGEDLKDLIGKDLDNEIKIKSIKYLPLWYTVTDDRGDVWRSKLNKALPQSSLNIRYRLRPINSKHIEILKSFNSVEAVDLYRKTIYPKLSDLYFELEKRSIITPGLSWFMDSDNYLSPFSSFPMNSLQFLLFSRPFQRIYEDVFLLDQEDREYLVDRARSIYLHFPDFLFDFFRNNLPMKKKVLEQQIRQFIFEWNVASTNLDSIWYLFGIGIRRGTGIREISLKKRRYDVPN